MYITNNFFEPIVSASNGSDFRSALRNCLNEITVQWWNDLEENERQAIILLDFDPSVVTTMAFFRDDKGFSDEYRTVLNTIYDKINLAANEEKMVNWGYELSAIIDFARAQVKAEQNARKKAIAIAREVELISGLDELEALLIRNNKTVHDMKKCKENTAKDLRRSFLSNALGYLRENYNKKEDE